MSWASTQQRYDAYMAALGAYRALHHKQREGQAHYNVVAVWDAPFAAEILGTDLDPFYFDERLPAYFAALRKRWDV